VEAIERRKRALAVACSVLLGIALTGCSEHAEKTAERSVSPLIGTWTRDGDIPKPNAQYPEFTELTFRPNGKLDATYVAAGGALAAVVSKAPKIKREEDTYATPTASTLSVAEGSSQRDFAFHVSDGKLYLTPAGASDAAVFSKGDGTS
jgi:hypothetical protein